MNLVIKILVSIVLFCSCSTSKQEQSKDIYLLIDKETTRNASMIKSQIAYLKFNQDEYLSEFLLATKNNLQNNITLENQTGKEIYASIFNEEQLDYLFEQTNSIDNIRYDKLKLDKNIIYQPQDEVGHENDMELLSRAYIFLSKPILTKNKDFGLVAFSNGVKGEMQSGICVYRNDNGSWKFVTTIDNRVE